MATQAEKMQAMMERMRADYVAALPAKFSAIEALVHRCIDVTPAPGEGAEDPRDELRRMVHSLKGSGATFGLPALSEQAGAFEALVLQWKASVAAGSAPPHTDMAVALDTALARLRSAAGTSCS